MKFATMARRIFLKINKIAALLVALALGAGQVSAGLIIRGGGGLVTTGADGIHYIGTSGLVMTGADRILGLGVNGITWSPVHDGLVMTGADGLVMTGADGLVMTGADGVSWRAESADSTSINKADGLVMTGADGLVMTGADGNSYQALSITIRQADGLVMTGADGLVMTGADGLRQTENNGLVMTGADGLVMTGADTIRLFRAAEVTVTGADGRVFTVSGDSLLITGSDGLVMTGADGIQMTNVQGLVMTGADGLVMTGADTAEGYGIKSFDPDLAKEIEKATDDSNINAAVVYHNNVTEADLADLRRIGVTGGTRFRSLPVVIISATPDQIFDISHLPTVRTVYGNRTLQWSADVSRQTTGVERARADVDLTLRNRGVAPSGAGVTVAVIDTGVDATHADLAGRVVRNVKLADVQGAPAPDFVYPANVEGLSSTDQAYGHGTFVAGIIAGKSTSTGGRYSGYAPGANIVGLSAGDASLFYVLAGFDYILQNRSALNIRVVNCSFSTNGFFDLDDPVNVATKMLTDAGVNVVFSAGNNGPGLNTLNPYARVPWVVSVGSTDEKGRPAEFSARGAFASGIFRPTLVAPGVNIVSTRAAGLNQTGALGLGRADATQLALTELPYYTMGSGTSFSAPQVAGTIALMLQANPNLTPEQVRSILRRTATPLPPYFSHEVGAGMLNAHAAVLEAAFPERRIGEFRATIDRGQVTFTKDAPYEFKGTAIPGAPHDTALTIPDGALLASVEVSWGPFQTINDLGLYLHDAANVPRAESNYVNLPGVTGKRERTVLTKPQAGTWHARVSHSIGLTATRQDFTGVFEIGRVEYAPISDIGVYAGTQTFEEIRQVLRTYVMLPDGNLFRPNATATRAELAQALILGGRAPLYVAAQPLYADVTDPWLRSYIESAQKAPTGSFFPIAQTSGGFNPNGRVDRLTAAIALVRAAGLEAEAQAIRYEPMSYVDARQIPAQWRGHAALAARYGFVPVTSDTLFGPQKLVSRVQLARAMVIIAERVSN